MEVKPYYCNFNFEEELERSNWSLKRTPKKNSLFEFLFLWIENPNLTLLADAHYSESFLEKIREHRGEIPHILTSQTTDYNCWWGDNNSLESWEREREINSKVTSFKAREKLGLEIGDSYLIESETELPILANETDFIIKEELGFSGRGQWKYEPNGKRKPKTPYIIEPLLNKLTDYGVTYTDIGESFVIENLNDANRQFKGGIFDSSLSYDSILKVGSNIFEYYKKKFGVNKLQIDMFEYEEKGKVQLIALCEVNHRKTMGYIIWKLHNLFGDVVSAMTINRPRDIIEGGLLLSPEGHSLCVQFFTAKTREDLQRKLTMNF